MKVQLGGLPADGVLCLSLFFVGPCIVGIGMEVPPGSREILKADLVYEMLASGFFPV